MTERERLVDILSTTIYPRIGADPTEVVADFLLDNGVIVPPVKVGDIVLDATALFDMTRKVPALSAFLFARFPGSYFIQNIDEQGKAEFYQWGSDLKSHVPVICRCT